MDTSRWLDDLDVNRLSQYVTYVSPPTMGVGSRILDTPPPPVMTSPGPTIGVGTNTSMTSPNPPSIGVGGTRLLRNKSDVHPHPLVPPTMEADPQWGTIRHPDKPRRVEMNPDVSRVKTPHPPAATVEADEEVAGGVVVEAVEVEAAEEEEVIPRLPRPSDRALPDAVPDDDVEIGFSTKPRCSNSWNKSCKINRWLRDVALQASRPPTPSRPPIKTDTVPP